MPSHLTNAQIACNTSGYITVNPNQQGVIQLTQTTLPSLSPGNTYYMNGDVDVSSSVTLGSINLVMAVGKKIRINQGGTLILSACQIRGCTQMWKGISIEGGSLITNNTTLIKDAQWGIHAEGAGSVSLNLTAITHCVYGIWTQGNGTSFSINSTKFYGGPLLTTYNGQPLPVAGLDKSYTGIFAKNRTLSLSASLSQSPCIFSKLLFGIDFYRSIINIRNTRFEDILSSPTLSINEDGTAIRGRGVTISAPSQFINWSELVVTGNGQTGSITFNNCETGIKTDKVNAVRVRNCRMDDMVLGIHATRARIFEVLNSEIKAMSSITAGLLEKEGIIQNNKIYSINTSGASFYGNTSTRTGIAVTGVLVASNPVAYLICQNNTLNVNGSYGPNNTATLEGINLGYLTTGTVVLQNTINLTNAYVNGCQGCMLTYNYNNCTGISSCDLSYGINLQSISYSLIKENTVQGPVGIWPTPTGTAGILVGSVATSFISCNDFREVEYGALFEGIVAFTPSYFGGNKLYKNTYGMLFSFNSQFGNIEESDNQWYSNASFPFSNSAVCDALTSCPNNTSLPVDYIIYRPDNVSNGPASGYTYDPITGLSTNTVCPYVISQEWVKLPLGTPTSGYDCNQAPAISELIAEYAFNVGNHQLHFEEFINENWYSARDAIYWRFDEEEALQLIYADYMDSIANTNIENFYGIHKTMNSFHSWTDDTINWNEQLPSLDSLFGVFVQIDSIFVASLNIPILDSAYFNDSLVFTAYFQELETISDSLDMTAYLTSVDDLTIALSVWDTTTAGYLMSLWSALEEFRIEILEENDAIEPINQIEENTQFVNHTWLTHWNDSLITLEGEELTLLENIAYSCPVTGGEAVLRAKRFLQNLGYVANPNYRTICWVDSIYYREGKPGNQGSNPVMNNYFERPGFTFISNPSNADQVGYTYHDIPASTELLIYDGLGRLVVQKSLQKGSSNNEILMISDQTGNFFWRVTNTNLKGKLIVK